MAEHVRAKVGRRPSSLEISHGVSWILGALFGLCAMEFGIWPVGIVVGAVGLALRIVIEHEAVRRHRTAVLTQWFRDGSS